MPRLTATLDGSNASALVSLLWTGTNLATNPSFRSGTTPVEVRRNYSTNPALQTGSTGWASLSGGVGSVSASRNIVGGPSGVTPYFFRITWTAITTGTPLNTGIVHGSGSSDVVGYESGYQHRASVYVRTTHADRTARLIVNLWDAAGTTSPATYYGETVAIGSGDWVRLSVNIPATNDAARAVLRIYGVGGTPWVVGDTLDATAALVERAGAVRTYFDGDTSDDAGLDYQWAGTRGSTVSQAMGQAPTTVSTALGANPYRGPSGDTLRLQPFYAGAGTMTSIGPFTAAVGDAVAIRFELRNANPIVSSERTVFWRGWFRNGSSNTNAATDSAAITLPSNGDWVTVSLPASGVALSGTNGVVLEMDTNATQDSSEIYELRQLVVEKVPAIGDAASSYFDGAMPGFKWDGTANASTSSVLTTATSANVVRVNIDDGSSSAVRNADPATLSGGQWIGTDYEVPLDAGFYYRATAPDMPGYSAISPSYVLDSAGRTFLKHPGRPALNSSVSVESAPDLARPVAQGVFDVLGRAQPVAVSMRRAAARGTLTLNTATESERAALLLLLDDGTPLLLATPEGYGLGNVYIAVGEVAEQRVTGTGYEWSRRWTLPFVIVDRPTGAALAVGNSWADVLATHASWDAMLGAEGTWAGVLEGLGS